MCPHCAINCNSFAHINQIKLLSKKLIAIIGIILAIALVSLSVWTAWPRWDSYNYFRFIEDLSPATLSHLEEMRIADHSAYSASIIYVILNGIFNNMLFTAYFVNFLLVIGGTYCFYTIIKRYYPDWKWYSYGVFSLVYMFSPFTFGILHSINLDSFLLFGLMLYFCAEVKNNNFLTVISAVIICFSKEIGPVILATTICVKLLYIYLENKKEKFDIKKFNPSCIASILLCGLVWFVDTLLNNWAGSNGGAATTDGSRFNFFGLSGVYLKDKIKTILFTNFTWLVLLVATVCLVVIIIKFIKGGEEKKKISSLTCQLFAVLVITFILAISFITYNHIRYNMLVVSFVYIFAVLLLGKIEIKALVKNVVVGVIALLFFVQAFITIDPMMYLTMDKIDCGNGYILATQNNLFVNQDVDNKIMLNLCDNVSYNRQSIYLDKALNKAIELTNYEKGKTCYVLSGEYYSPSLQENVSSEYLVLGNGYQYYTEKARYVAWNNRTKSRYLSKNPEDNMAIFFIDDHDDLKQALSEYEEVYYIKTPFGDENFRNNVLLGNNVTYIESVVSNVWKLELYKISQ